MPRIYFTIIGGQPGYSIIPSGGALSAQQIVNGIASNLYAYGYAPQNINVNVSTFGNVTATFYTDEDCTYNGLATLREGIANILSNARIITSPTVSSSPSEIQLCGSGGAIQQEPGIFASMQSLFGQNYLGGSGSGSTYTVRSGDTMSRIAARYNMTLAQLMALNPQIRNANVISVGQVINVSGSGGGVGSLGLGGSLITAVNSNTGQVTATPVVNQQGAPPPKEKDDRNWFDKTFFDGAGALTGTAIGVLVVLGAVVLVKSQQQ